MVNKTIIDTLKPLNIPVYYMQAGEKEVDKYIIFNIYREVDTDIYDNNNLSETYYITLNFWFSNPNDLSLYSEIKKLMKQNKFKFDKSVDTIDGDFYGKNLDFIYKKYL